MEFIDVLLSRRSIRSFKPDPIPQITLKNILEECLWAPSWANTQPWEFAVAAGSALKDIVKGYLAKGEAKPYPDIARPPEFPEPYISRIKALAPPGPPPTKEQMEERRVRSFSHYGAPAVIYVLIDRSFFYQKDKTRWGMFEERNHFPEPGPPGVLGCLHVHKLIDHDNSISLGIGTQKFELCRNGKSFLFLLFGGHPGVYYSLGTLIFRPCFIHSSTHFACFDNSFSITVFTNSWMVISSSAARMRSFR